MFVESLAVFGVGSLVAAAAWSLPLLLLGRAVQAFGAGGLLPVAAAVIAETVPIERRGRTLGLIGAVFGVAFLFGPLLGGLLLRSSWRWLFLVNVPVVLALMAVGARLLPQVVRSEARRFDALGAVVLAIVLAALVAGIGQLDTTALAASVQSLRVWPCFAVLAVGVPVLWASREARRRSGSIACVARSPQLRVVGAIAIAVGSVEAGMVFLPDIAVLNFGVDAATASLTMLPLVLTLGLGAPLAGWLLDRVGPRIVVQIGLALTVAGLLLVRSVAARLAQFLRIRRHDRLRHVGIARRPVALYRLAGSRRESARRRSGSAHALRQHRPARRCGCHRRRRRFRERRVAGLPAVVADRSDRLWPRLGAECCVAG